MIVLKILGTLAALALLVFCAVVNHDRRRARREQHAIRLQRSHDEGARAGRARREYERLEFGQHGAGLHIVRGPGDIHRGAQKAIDQSGGETS